LIFSDEVLGMNLPVDALWVENSLKFDEAGGEQ